jgi:carboxymethylenebutenolidase
VADVRRFRDCLEKHNKNYHVRIYRDAPHGWLNDTMPGRFRSDAAEDAWRLMMSFLKKSFGGGWDKDRVVWKFESDYATQYDFSKNVRME